MCAFENRPRAKACTMCGTSRATAVEYYQQMRKAAGLDYEEDAAGTVYTLRNFLLARSGLRCVVFSFR